MFKKWTNLKGASGIVDNVPDYKSEKKEQF